MTVITPVSREWQDEQGNPDPKYRKLVEPYAFDFRGFRIQIQPGFVWDRASIPWIAQRLIPKTHLGSGPPLTHDYLYRHAFEYREKQTGEVFSSEGRSVLYDRNTTDLFFRDFMGEWGISQWRVKLASGAVRVGGRGAWRSSARFAVEWPDWDRQLPSELALPSLDF